MISSSLWEKFQRATLTLARSGPIKDRLSDAYRNCLEQIDASELPGELQADFTAFMDAVMRERPMLRGEDSFRATVRKMSAEEAENLASVIVHLFSALPRDVPASARAKTTAHVVPLFLSKA